MTMPGLTAERSLYATRGHYRSGRPSTSQSDAVIPAIPNCANCPFILLGCMRRGWRPRALCGACLLGYCYEEPPPPDPFEDPFGRPQGF